MLCRDPRSARVRPLEEFPSCSKLVREAVRAFGLPPRFSDPELDPGRLNVIIRAYGRGQWLGRHVDDVQMFAGPVLSVVLQPGAPADGLRLSLPRGAQGLAAARAAAEAAGQEGLQEPATTGIVRVVETAGLSVCLEREARYLFGHEIRAVAEPRISMTWRWFRDDYLRQLDDVLRWMQEED